MQIFEIMDFNTSAPNSSKIWHASQRFFLPCSLENVIGYKYQVIIWILQMDTREGKEVGKKKQKTKQNIDVNRTNKPEHLGPIGPF